MAYKAALTGSMAGYQKWSGWGSTPNWNQGTQGGWNTGAWQPYLQHHQQTSKQLRNTSQQHAGQSQESCIWLCG
eukprot:12929000-Prorocentrum_lima.AAC.1